MNTRALQELDTIPPPSGERDAYSAATVVRGVSEALLKQAKPLSPPPDVDAHAIADDIDDLPTLDDEVAEPHRVHTAIMPESIGLRSSGISTVQVIARAPEGAPDPTIARLVMQGMLVGVALAFALVGALAVVLFW